MHQERRGRAGPTRADPPLSSILMMSLCSIFPLGTFITMETGLTRRPGDPEDSNTVTACPEGTWSIMVLSRRWMTHAFLAVHHQASPPISSGMGIPSNLHRRAIRATTPLKAWVKYAAWRGIHARVDLIDPWKRMHHDHPCARSRKVPRMESIRPCDLVILILVGKPFLLDPCHVDDIHI